MLIEVIMLSSLRILILLLVSPMAFAEEMMGQGPMSSLLLMGLMFFLVYFIMVRPQNKKQKEHTDMLQNLGAGDEIVTSGGILGKIVKSKNDFFTINISQGVDIAIKRVSVSQILPNGTIKSL